MKRLFSILTIAFSLSLFSGCLLIPVSVDESDTQKNPITLFETPGDILPYKSFCVNKVLSDGSAIAYASEDVNNKYWYGVRVVIYNDNDAAYYDEQVIRLSSKKCRHIGTYKQYSDTFPVVRFE